MPPLPTSDGSPAADPAAAAETCALLALVADAVALPAELVALEAEAVALEAAEPADVAAASL
ncbi:hypothetical protein [Pseudomonas sp. UMAB-08]|uniref:hypothetical protein n=1 Tax=Pseudomonas sp. UMAB-08 TaxID=1365375 RepID=UPI001C587340|nr:hypothetical protein [Pseudomonas sp. UMAB-08]